MKATLSVLAMFLVTLALPAVAQDAAAQAELVLDEVILVAPERQAAPGTPPATGTTTTDEEEKPDQPAPEPTPEPTPEEPADPGVLKFHLMDGTIITGQLTTNSLPISTDFGDLVVPMDAIASFAPGLSSHPEIDKTINQFIAQLGSPDAKTRDKAQAQLISYGTGLLPVLMEYANDPDAERKVRIATITEELMGMESDDFGPEQGPTVSLKRLDQIVTERFTIAGKIQQKTFTIASKFGELTVKLKDIKSVQQITTDKPELRKTVAVSGMDMTCRNYKKTGIRVNRGDRIMISSEGRITMSPWGSNSVSGPDGMPNNGMYKGKIPMGALAGRIGDSGEEFLVGSKKSFVAKKTGMLQLGFAMQQNWANYQFPGEYKTRIRVVPAE